MIELFVKSNAKVVAKNFKSWIDKSMDMTGAFSAFIPEFRNSREGWNRAQRTVDGRPYTPLSLKYKDWKSKNYPGRGILHLSGDLMRAVTGGSGWISQVGSKNLMMGVDLNYASYVEDGTGEMPQRNYFLTATGSLSRMDMAQLIQAIEEHIDDTTSTMLNKSIFEADY